MFSSFKEGKITYWVYDLLQFSMGFFTIILSIVSAVLFIHNNYGIFLIVLIIALITALICMFFIAYKLRTLAKARLSEFTKQFHKFTHQMRDAYYDILNNYKKNTLNIDCLTNIMIPSVKDFLDQLCTIFNASTGKRVSACVKIINPVDEHFIHNNTIRLTKKNALVTTLCRDSNQESSRNNNSGVKKVCENTDFAEILFNDKDVFYESDLKEFDKRLRKSGDCYLNTTKNFEQYYIATIVCPIRIDNKFQNHKKAGKSYNIIGFVCVDSLSKDAFRDKDFERRCNSDLVKAFADELFVFLERCKFFYEKLKNKTGGNYEAAKNAVQNS